MSNTNFVQTIKDLAKEDREDKADLVLAYLATAIRAYEKGIEVPLTSLVKWVTTTGIQNTAFVDFVLILAQGMNEEQ